MSSHGKNTALRVLLDEAEMSNSGLASAVVASGAREGIHLGTGTTSVKRMLEGSQPRWPVPRLVATVLSRRLRRQVSVTECGFADRTPAEQDPHDGLHSSRPRCFAQTDLATAHLLGRDLEQAAAFGRDALRTASEVNSIRTLDRLRTLQRQVRPLHSATPHLADLDDRITDFLTRTTRRQNEDSDL